MTSIADELKKNPKQKVFVVERYFNIRTSVICIGKNQKEIEERLKSQHGSYYLEDKCFGFI